MTMIDLLTRRRTFVWLLVAAAAARLGTFAAFQRVFDFEATGIVHGSAAYDTYARNLLATMTYGLQPGVPDAVLPPLYSAMLAAVYSVFGRGGLPVVLFNVICDLIALVALHRLGARLFPAGAAVGTLAAACTAFYPYLIFQSVTVVDTSIFVALLYVFLALAVGLRDAAGGRTILLRGALCGAILGLATLTRPITPPLVALVAVWLTLAVGARGMLTRMLPVTLTAALVLTPWVWRNTELFGRVVPLTTNAGSNLWQGNNPNTVAYLRAGYDVQWTPPPRIDAVDPLGPEADVQLYQHAVAFLRQHPDAIPSLLWTKLRVQWSIDVSPRVNPSPDGPPAAPGLVTAHVDRGGGVYLTGVSPDEPVAMYARPLFDSVGRSVHKLYWGSLFTLGIVGVLLSLKRWQSVALALCPAMALTIVYVVTHPSTRYRAPGDPGWFLFAAVALLHIPLALRRGQSAAAIDRATADAALPPAACWIGSASYRQPLDPSTSRKWRALSQLGVRMHVVAFSSDWRSRRFTEHARFHLLPRLPFAWARRAVMLLVAPPIVLWLAARHEARVVIAQGPIEGALAAPVTTLLTRLGRPVALVVESHGDFESSLPLYRRLLFPRITPSVRRRLAAFALRRAAVGRAVSNATRRQLLSLTPGLSIEMCPTWIDVDRFANVDRPSPPAMSRDILFVGGLVPIKGAHVLVDAFARVRDRLGEVRLILAGPAAHDGYGAVVRAQIAASRLERHVDLVGALSAAQVADLMARSRVVVLPSLSEGLPRAALESMLTGTPVIASRVGGLPEIVREAETGWLVPPNDAAALSEALLAAFEYPEIDVLGERAKAFARKMVSSDAYVAAHGRLLSAAAQRAFRA
jgi:glycosyltransferase involved in cell wall biosynthesis